MDYSENICQAIDTIVSKRMTELKFDITDIYTIVDNSNKAKGMYTVTKDNISFEAFGNLSYNTGDDVYVTIPQGDWDQTKFIVGPAKYSDQASTIAAIEIPALFASDRIFGDIQTPIDTYNYNAICVEFEMCASPAQPDIVASWETAKAGPQSQTLYAFGNNGVTFSKQKHYLTIQGNDKLQSIAFQLPSDTIVKNIKLYLTTRTNYSLLEEIQELKETLQLLIQRTGGINNG